MVNALVDLESLKSSIGNEALDIESSIFNVFPKSIHHLLTQTMKINKALLEKQQKEIQATITKMKYKECMGYLSKVESIPRLYRRTNRTFPQEASSYVVSAVDVLLKFNSRYKEIGAMDVFRSTVNVIVEQTSNQ